MMEFASEIMPIILYLLLSILVIVAIVLMYKLLHTIDKANQVLDDIYIKVKKLDNFFDIVDKGADTINMLTDKVTGIVTSSIMKIFKKKRRDDIYE